jgi:hypothetical protein
MPPWVGKNLPLYLLLPLLLLSLLAGIFGGAQAFKACSMFAVVPARVMSRLHKQLLSPRKKGKNLA